MARVRAAATAAWREKKALSPRRSLMACTAPRVQ
jgi:hypothetical protein